MKCLVCDRMIRIETLKQLFSLQPLKLCLHCSIQLVPKSDNVLFEENIWLHDVVARLNKGDLILLEIFKKRLKRLLKQGNYCLEDMDVIEFNEDLPFPWLHILFKEIKGELKQDLSPEGKSTLVLAVVKQENHLNQLIIMG